MLDTKLIPAAKADSKHLMIVLHGLGDSMNGFTWLPHELNVPSLNYLLVNAPDPYGPGFSWFDYYGGEPEPGILRSRKLINELLEKTRADGFPAQQTFLFGFSQGCLMTLEVGLRYPQKLAGLIGISGRVFQADTLVRELSPVAKQQRVLMTHGHYDTVIPYAPVKDDVEFLQRAGLDIKWQEYAKDHTIAGAEEVALIRKFVEAGLQ